METMWFSLGFVLVGAARWAGWYIGSAWSWLVVFRLFLYFFFDFGGKFAIVKRDARLDLVLVLAGPILLQAFAGDE